MASNNRKHGYQGQVLIGGVAVASVSKWTLDMTASRADVTCFGDAHKKYVQGIRDMKGTLEGVVDLDSASPAEGNAAFLNACKANTLVTLKLVPDSVDNVADYFSGEAVLDVQIECDANGAIKFSGTWAASGETDWAGAGLLASA